MTVLDGGLRLCLLLCKHLITMNQTKSTDKWWKTCLVVLNHGGIKIRTMTRIRLAYPSFRLSPIEAGLTDILGWVEMELCDWLLVKDDVSRLTGDIGGVGLLPSECVSEPGVTEDIKIEVTFGTSRCCSQTEQYLCQIQWREDNELEGS